MTDFALSGRTFCPTWVLQAQAFGLGPAGCTVYDSQGGPINNDGTLHRHCEVCGEEAIGYSKRQAEQQGITHRPRGGWFHILDNDCPGSWGYDIEGAPFWRSQRTKLDPD